MVLGVDVAVGGSLGGQVDLVHLRLQEGAGSTRSDLGCVRCSSEARLPAVIGQPLPKILHAQPRSVLGIEIAVGVHADNELAVRVSFFQYFVQCCQHAYAGQALASITRKVIIAQQQPRTRVCVCGGGTTVCSSMRVRTKQVVVSLGGGLSSSQCQQAEHGQMTPVVPCYCVQGDGHV